LPEIPPVLPFSKGGELWEIRWSNSFHFFPLWKREAVKKFNVGRQKPLSLSGPPNFLLPEFFHSFRGMKGDLTAFQKAKVLHFSNVIRNGKPYNLMEISPQRAKLRP
jgi:hypothetical protein